MAQPLKIYADCSPYSPGVNNYHLSNVLKYIWNDLTPAQRFATYGEIANLFEPTASIAEADLCLLTMQWPYYVEHGILAQAAKEASFARQHDKPFVVFSAGDAPARLPFDGAVLLELAGYRSTDRLRYHTGHPAFINKDYLDLFCGGALQMRPWREEPVIGFCGQADAQPVRSLYRAIRLYWRKARYVLGISRWEPPPFETVRFRSRVLRRFAGQPGIQTNFVLHKRYHAGESGKRTDSSPAKTAFVQNTLDADYVVCVRGGGNYSLRFYETLALGRIPVFIDTDCLLPFDDIIPYRKIFPWVPVEELPRAAEIVMKFHHSLSPADFANVQRACRSLWVQHFQRLGFYNDFFTKMEELI